MGPVTIYTNQNCYCLVAKSCPTLCNPMGCRLCPWDFSRQEYWNGLPFPSPGDLLDPVMLSRALWDSWTWRPFCLPFHVGMTAASKTFSKFQRVKKVKVTQSRPTLCDPMDCSLPGSCVHGIAQARILEWVAIRFCKESSRPRDQACVFCIAGRFFTICATREAWRAEQLLIKGEAATEPPEVRLKGPETQD